MNFMLFIGLHWVGDFLFQSTAMATNKHHSWRWLGLHILAYSIVLMTGTVFFFPWEVTWKFVLINALLHGVTDLVTSRMAAAYQDEPRLFYLILGLDQGLHHAALYMTYLMILNGSH